MVRYVQLVIGAAGSGKSTYCSQLYEYCISVNRLIHIVNLDPAAEIFDYPVSFDIRELITLDDVMEELRLGPNGGLLYCMEFLEDCLEDWLADFLEGYSEQEYLIFDCPGEIELYSHVCIFKTLIQFLKRNNWRICAVYTIDSHFITDTAKFISGAMQALSAMLFLEVPHINLLTKMDLCPTSQQIKRFLYPDMKTLSKQISDNIGPRFQKMNHAIGTLLDDYSLVNFVPLDLTNNESIKNLLLQIDIAMQYGDESEIQAKEFE